MAKVVHRLNQTIRPRKAESAFTLVELLVVIVIIGVLAGVLLPAAMRAFKSAKEARITTEISQIAAALERYKIEYGEYPPDFSFLYLAGTTSPFNDETKVNDHLRRNFRNRVVNGDPPFVWRNEDTQRLGGTPPNNPNPDPAEALFYWLGGTPPAGRVAIFGGYSKNPAQPKRALSGERTPMFEFDPARLDDKDEDGLLEYYPPGGNQAPYVYFRSTDYIPLLEMIANPPSGANPISQVANGLRVSPYLTSTESTMNKQFGDIGKPNLPLNKKWVSDDFAAANKFQLISAGLDGEFGDAPLDMAKQNLDGWRQFGFPGGPYLSPSGSKAHLDNITNFAEGTLEKQIP